MYTVEYDADAEMWLWELRDEQGRLKAHGWARGKLRAGVALRMWAVVLGGMRGIGAK